MTHPHHHHDRLFPAEYAANLDDPARHDRQPPRAIVDALALTEGCRVLDFGAGTGYYAVPIAKRLHDLGTGGKVVAVDSQGVMLEHLAAKLVDLEGAPIVMVAGSTDAVQAMEEASLDRALMANVAHEIPDRNALFDATFRALAPGGLLLVLDWDPEGSTAHGPPLDHRLKPDEVFRAMAQAGFSDIEALPCYPDHFALRAKRP